MLPVMTGMDNQMSLKMYKLPEKVCDCKSLYAVPLYPEYRTPFLSHYDFIILTRSHSDNNFYLSSPSRGFKYLSGLKLSKYHKNCSTLTELLGKAVNDFSKKYNHKQEWSSLITNALEKKSDIYAAESSEEDTLNNDIELLEEAPTPTKETFSRLSRKKPHLDNSIEDEPFVTESNTDESTDKLVIDDDIEFLEEVSTNAEDILAQLARKKTLKEDEDSESSRPLVADTSGCPSPSENDITSCNKSPSDDNKKCKKESELSVARKKRVSILSGGCKSHVVSGLQEKLEAVKEKLLRSEMLSHAKRCRKRDDLKSKVRILGSKQKKKKISDGLEIFKVEKNSHDRLSGARLKPRKEASHTSEAHATCRENDSHSEPKSCNNSDYSASNDERLPCSADKDVSLSAKAPNLLAYDKLLIDPFMDNSVKNMSSGTHSSVRTTSLTTTFASSQRDLSTDLSGTTASEKAPEGIAQSTCLSVSDEIEFNKIVTNLETVAASSVCDNNAENSVHTTIASKTNEDGRKSAEANNSTVPSSGENTDNHSKVSSFRGVTDNETQTTSKLERNKSEAVVTNDTFDVVNNSIAVVESVDDDPCSLPSNTTWVQTSSALGLTPTCPSDVQTPSIVTNVCVTPSSHDVHQQPIEDSSIKQLLSCSEQKTIPSTSKSATTLAQAVVTGSSLAVPVNEMRSNSESIVNKPIRVIPLITPHSVVGSIYVTTQPVNQVVTVSQTTHSIGGSSEGGATSTPVLPYSNYIGSSPGGHNFKVPVLKRPFNLVSTSLTQRSPNDTSTALSTSGESDKNKVKQRVIAAKRKPALVLSLAPNRNKVGAVNVSIASDSTNTKTPNTLHSPSKIPRVGATYVPEPITKEGGSGSSMGNISEGGLPSTTSSNQMKVGSSMKTGDPRDLLNCNPKEMTISSLDNLLGEFQKSIKQQTSDIESMERHLYSMKETLNKCQRMQQELCEVRFDKSKTVENLNTQIMKIKENVMKYRLELFKNPQNPIALYNQLKCSEHHEKLRSKLDSLVGKTSGPASIPASLPAETSKQVNGSTVSKERHLGSSSDPNKIKKHKPSERRAIFKLLDKFFYSDHPDYVSSTDFTKYLSNIRLNVNAIEQYLLSIPEKDRFKVASKIVFQLHQYIVNVAQYKTKDPIDPHISKFCEAIVSVLKYIDLTYSSSSFAIEENHSVWDKLLQRIKCSSNRKSNKIEGPVILRTYPMTYTNSCTDPAIDPSSSSSCETRSTLKDLVRTSDVNKNSPCSSSRLTSFKSLPVDQSQINSTSSKSPEQVFVHATDLCEPVLGTDPSSPQQHEIISSNNTADNEDTLKCNVCEKESIYQCGACQIVAYCSEECQIKDWDSHKNVCGESCN